jgi:hypothetical protein
MHAPISALTAGLVFNYGYEIILLCLEQKTAPMKKIWLFLLFYPLISSSQIPFEKYFSQGSMRLDFILAGNHEVTNAYFQGIRREPFWGGSRLNLVDTAYYGSCIFKVFSVATGELIFSGGFSTLYQEWTTTAEAKIIDKGFSETVTIPFPRDEIRFELYERDKMQKSKKLLSVVIDPENYFIQPSPEDNYELVEILKTGDPSRSVDLVFLPEGYTDAEMAKFLNDVRRLSDSLLSAEPFRHWKNRFNISAVLAPSSGSGADVPGKGIWRNTILNSTFYTFGSERYLTTFDYWKVRDLASLAPYDQICVLVNTSRYGGGGIYNHYSLTSVDHNLAHITFIHEFGHGFAGLGDEYYDSEVAYQEYYDRNTEPWEPNLTTLVEFNNKWKSMLAPGTPVPTPDREPYNRGIGAFEGGGYTAKGVYRPQVNCWMKGFRAGGFCIVCQKSIERMLHWSTD